MKKAAEIRKMSGEAKAVKSSDIMDVNQQAVAAIMRKHGVRRLIHGHTHRPDIHHFELNGQPAERIVLADWQIQGSSTVQADTNNGETRVLPVQIVK